MSTRAEFDHMKLPKVCEDRGWALDIEWQTVPQRRRDINFKFTSEKPRRYTAGGTDDLDETCAGIIKEQVARRGLPKSTDTSTQGAAVRLREIARARPGIEFNAYLDTNQFESSYTGTLVTYDDGLPIVTLNASADSEAELYERFVDALFEHGVLGP